MALLADEEDKTRANAAGALGNLVRNSDALCVDLLDAGALQVCLNPRLETLDQCTIIAEHRISQPKI